MKKADTQGLGLSSNRIMRSTPTIFTDLIGKESWSFAKRIIYLSNISFGMSFFSFCCCCNSFNLFISTGGNVSTSFRTSCCHCGSLTGRAKICLPLFSKEILLASQEFFCCRQRYYCY